MIRRACVAGVVSVVSVVPPAAAEERPFGTAGDIVLTNGVGLSLSHSTFEAGGWSSRHSSIQLYPNASVFVLPGLSLGGGPSYSHSWGTFETGEARASSSADRLGGTLRIGYALNLGERVTLWPGAFAWVSHGWSRTDQPVLDDGRSLDGGGGADVLGLFHVTPSFFIGFGPRVSRSVNDSAGDRHYFTGIETNSFIGGRL